MKTLEKAFSSWNSFWKFLSSKMLLQGFSSHVIYIKIKMCKSLHRFNAFDNYTYVCDTCKCFSVPFRKRNYANKLPNKILRGQEEISLDIKT